VTDGATVPGAREEVADVAVGAGFGGMCGLYELHEQGLRVRV